ncbi:MAG: SAM-dependent chlorinase/fluorinase [Patescibacteria group bacterium]|nr:SAM-dependent chlorinase/fluorinase [Patescibacteria group bacterium]
MFVTIITDCKEENEKGRQVTRWASLGFTNINIVGVSSDLGSIPTIEAAGNIIDSLDASEGKEGVVFANVAPRGYIKEDGENGTDFAYFYYKKTLVVSTIRGYTLSLVKKLNLVNQVSVVKLVNVLDHAKKIGLIDETGMEYIKNSQFRSFDYVPRLVSWIFKGEKFPTENLQISTRKNAPNCIWCIDAFGNAKTTIASNEISFSHGELIQTNFGKITFYNRLKDIPEGKAGIYIGSSGIKDVRFLEIAVQSKKGSAQKAFGFEIGDKVNFSKF